MRLQAKDIEIPENNPFEHDRLGFGDSSETLTNFISSCEGPGVIVVDGPWGSGKTTFLRMWEWHYRELGGSVVHFNAWDSDYFDDVLVSVIEEIRRQLVVDGKASGLMRSVKSSAVDLMKALIPFGARVATAGVVNFTSKDLEGLADVAEGFATKKLAAYEESKKSLKRFKDDLAEFVKNTRENDDDKPVVIVVDELDRCRPGYAIEVLETIKHIFDVDGLIFVLGTDLEQLAGVISGRYGQEFNSSAYLVRFFDIKVNLPETSDVSGLIEGFIHRMDASKLFPERRDNYIGNKASLVSALREFGECYKLSKRDIQRVLASLATYAATLEDRNVVFPLFSAWLAVVRHHDASLYKKIKSGTLPVEDVAKAIRAKVSEEFWSSRQAGLLLAEVLIVMLGEDARAPIINSPQEYPVLASAGSDRGENSAMHLAQHLLTAGGFMLTGPYLRYVISRMELLEPMDR